VESDRVTGRLHARSRAKRAPRAFSAATGLTGGAAADLDVRAESADPPEPKKAAAPGAVVTPVLTTPREPEREPELAKLNQDEPPAPGEGTDRVEGSGGRRIKRPNVKVPHVKLPSLKVPTGGRRRVDRPPRVFRLDDPGTSPGLVAPGGAGAAIGAARAPEPMTPARAQATGASRAADPVPPESEAVEPEPPSAPPPPAVTTPRSKSAPSKSGTGPTGRRSTTALTGVLTKAWRGPRAGRPWRERKSANRRPVDPTRPTSAKATPGSPSRRLALPKVGRRTSVKTSGATGATKASRRTLLTRTSKTGGPSAKKKRQKQRTPATPLERRRRIPVAVAGLFALAVLATSFPLAGLVSQHRQLSAAAAQLQQVQRDNRSLAEQQHALNSNQAVNQLARGEYQMVSPGQTLYEVLPPSSKTGTTTPGAATSGDPGNQPLVAPANAPDLSPQPGLPQPIPAAAGSSAGAGATKGGGASGPPSSGPGVSSTPSSFWGRVTDTLEFWK
jgi:cell division protein FtsB